MRILFVSNKCCYFGGVEQNIADTAIGLTQNGHDCFLAYLEDSLPQESYQNLFKGTYFIDLSQKNSFTPLPAVDVVYFHKISALPDFELFKGLKSRPLFVRMVHDHDLICPRRHRYFAFPPHRNCHLSAGWYCWLDSFFQRNTMGNCGFFSLKSFFAEMEKNKRLDKIILASRFMSQALQSNGFSAAKLQVIAPAVDTAHLIRPDNPMEFLRPSKLAIDFPADKPCIIYVGQLLRGKGVDLLLRAAVLLKQDFHLLIVGLGNAESSLRKLVQKLALTQQVTFWGWADQEELRELYHLARVCVVPSRWSEPYGLIGLEAMSHAKPVVAFNVGGISDWLQHEKTGFLVPERDIVAYAKSLDLLLEDGNLAQKMGLAGWESVRQEFNFYLYIDKLLSVLTCEN